MSGFLSGITSARAARQALAIQQDPDSIANVFHIADADEGFIVIDLSELDQEAASHGKV